MFTDVNNGEGSPGAKINDQSHVQTRNTSVGGANRSTNELVKGRRINRGIGFTTAMLGEEK